MTWSQPFEECAADCAAEYEKPIDGQDGERISAAYVQLEKHNERLKEALIRLVAVERVNIRQAASQLTE